MQWKIEKTRRERVPQNGRGRADGRMRGGERPRTKRAAATFLDGKGAKEQSKGSDAGEGGAVRGIRVCKTNPATGDGSGRKWHCSWAGECRLPHRKLEDEGTRYTIKSTKREAGRHPRENVFQRHGTIVVG